MAKQKNTTLNSVIELLSNMEKDLKRAKLIIEQIVEAGGGDIEVDTSKIADLESAASKLSSTTTE